MLFTSCDPTFQVDYKVTNNTSESIKIWVDYFGNPSDTNIISSGTTLIFYNDFGIGFTTHDYLDGLNHIPVELSILNQADHPYNKSEEDISNWVKYYPSKKSEGTGSVELTVRSEDFN